MNFYTTPSFSNVSLEGIITHVPLKKNSLLCVASRDSIKRIKQNKNMKIKSNYTISNLEVILDKKKNILEKIAKFCLKEYPIDMAITNIFTSIKLVSAFEKDASKIIYFNGDGEESRNGKGLILKSPYGDQKYIIRHQGLPIFDGEGISLRPKVLFIGYPKDIIRDVYPTIRVYFWKKSKKLLRISYKYFYEEDFDRFMFFGKDKIKEKLEEYPINLDKSFLKKYSLKFTGSPAISSSCLLKQMQDY